MRCCIAACYTLFLYAALMPVSVCVPVSLCVTASLCMLVCLPVSVCVSVSVSVPLWVFVCIVAGVDVELISPPLNSLLSNESGRQVRIDVINCGVISLCELQGRCQCG